MAGGDGNNEWVGNVEITGVQLICSVMTVLEGNVHRRNPNYRWSWETGDQNICVFFYNFLQLNRVLTVSGIQHLNLNMILFSLYYDHPT